MYTIWRQSTFSVPYLTLSSLCTPDNQIPLAVIRETAFFFGRARGMTILAPQPGMEAVPLQWKRGVSTTEPPGKSQKLLSKGLLKLVARKILKNLDAIDS